MRRLLVICALAALAGCTDPQPRLIVTVTSQASVASQPYDQAYAGAILCNYEVNATTAGGGKGEFAEWLSIAQRWELTGTGYVASDTITAADAALEWGSDRIYTGQTFTEQRGAYWSGPFTLERVYTYRLTNGHVDSTKFLLTCT